jgi:two-component system sensor histidine kinase PilS (NtrC family)
MMEHARKLTWFITARIVVVTLFLAAIIFLNIKEPATIGTQALFRFTNLFIVTYAFSIFSLLALKPSARHIRGLTYLQIIWDLMFVTILLYMTGGTDSPFSFLYLLSIINASVLLARKEAIYTASLCSILYGAMVNLLYYRVLTPPSQNYLPPLQYDNRYIFYIAILNIFAFYAVAFLTGILAEQARKSESALKDKIIDFEELERIYSSVVSNLSSGLLTVNREGKIRVFNHYAEKLAGITQEDAYDKPLVDVFPDFVAFAGGDEHISRGEIKCRTIPGEIRILGFNSVPLIDKNGERDGHIINFQDLTRIKKLEEELKRTDRLVAVGELSASIAHEIRNPLASISGSVQMIANGDGIAERDRKLLDIVLRETDRLNDLIRDFLVYARPVKPVKMKIEIRRFLSDLFAQLPTDPRFKGIRFNYEAPGNLFISVDTDQFKQVFWNLLINSAEAMNGEGRIAIDVSEGGVESLDMGYKDLVKIVIADTGCGMNEEQTKRLFEPFYTTKAGGTGLGLATVYRIVEAHGGRIEVFSIKGTGTEFKIIIPAHDHG